jgi:hypothetical protein
MAYTDFPGGSTTYGVFAAGFVGDPNAALTPLATVEVGDTVWIAFDVTAFFGATNGTVTVNDFPSEFVPTQWLKSPASVTLPQSSQSWSAGPILSTPGNVINLGNPVLLSGNYKYWVLWQGAFSSVGSFSFELEFNATGSTGPLTIPFTATVVPPSVPPNPNLAIPFACQPGVLGWEPEFGAGKLEFLDNANYTIPNYAVRFTGAGPFELMVATLSGEDVEVVSGTIGYPRVERKRVARIACQMLFGVTPAGAAHASVAEGMVTNWSELNALSDLTVTNVQGLQTVEYTPYIGATSVQVEAHVLPPVVGEVSNGIGMTFGLVLEVPDPSLLP